MTRRPEERHEALARALGELSRERLATGLTLGPLSEAEVARMVQLILRARRGIPPELQAEVYRLAEGNPCFVEEILGALAAAGDLVPGEAPPETRGRVAIVRVPGSVRETTCRQLERLSAGARRMLEYAAVAGRRFDFELLRRVLGLGEADLLRCIEEAVAARLVVEETTDRFGCRHALAREAIYRGLLARERRRHGEIAAALEAMRGDGAVVHDADLALQFSEAQAWGKALAFPGSLRPSSRRRIFSPGRTP